MFKVNNEDTSTTPLAGEEAWNVFQYNLKYIYFPAIAFNYQFSVADITNRITAIVFNYLC